MAKLSSFLLLLLTAGCSHDTRQAMEVLRHPSAPLTISPTIRSSDPPLVKEAKDEEQAEYILTRPKHP